MQLTRRNTRLGEVPQLGEAWCHKELGCAIQRLCDEGLLEPVAGLSAVEMFLSKKFSGSALSELDCI